MTVAEPTTMKNCDCLRYPASAISQNVDGYARTVWFEPGYDFDNEHCRNQHGRHGMSIRFVLSAEEGAVQFLMYTSDWLPGLARFNRGPMHGPMGADLGHHWMRPVYDGEEAHGNCEYLHGAPCFYDGSGLAADDVMDRFFTEGLDGVWDELEQYHRDCSERAAKVATGDSK